MPYTGSPMPSLLSSSLLFTYLFAAALVVGLLLKVWLASRQIRSVAQHQGEVPTAFVGHISLAAH